MGCNFAVDFVYRWSCNSRGFKLENDLSVSSIAAFLAHFKEEERMSALRDFNMLVALSLNEALPLKVNSPIINFKTILDLQMY